MSAFELIGPLDRPDGIKEDERINTLAIRAQRIEPFTRPPQEYARDYVATPELRMAVDVALSLGRPLLLTGEPGSGKTLAARWIADRLGLVGDYYEEFQVRSDARARDLRYEFDAVGWFRESQIDKKPVDKSKFLHARALGKAFGWNGEPARPYVVLIDEIDKAPRDFPNDLLLELDQMRFVIEETQRQVGPPKHRPIVVITSNAERRLPDPFLRRCVTHYIELDSKTVMEILARRMAGTGAQPQLLDAATKFWVSLASRGLARKPTIAEFWQWLALETRYGKTPMPEIEQALTTQQIGKLDFISTLFSASDFQRIVGIK